MDKKTQNRAQELSQIFKRISRLELEGLPSRELKPSECRLLGRLYFSLGDGTGTVKTSELSNQLGITPAAITHLVNPLEKGGYIERLPDSNDRRVVLVGLTEQGKGLAQELVAHADKKLFGLIEYLGEEDSQTFIRLMSAAIEYFESAEE